MTEFGDKDPLLDHEEKDDENEDSDEEEVNRNPFETGGGALDPSEDIPMSTMNRNYGKEGARPKTSQTSYIEGDTLGTRLGIDS